MIDETEIRRWWDIFKSPDVLTEVRVLGSGKTFSGYFTDVDTMLEALHANRDFEGYGIYATINRINDACYSRTQHDCFISKPKTTTSDNDIARRTVILIDFDPKRPSDTNSSDEEKAKAQKKMRDVYRFLRDQGFEAPVVADSANGYHLYYKINLEASDQSRELVKGFLDALDMLFSDEDVDVDVSVFNAARIAKVIGTVSNKGTNTADRPQRLSSFVHVPDEFKETGAEFIEKVAAMVPKPEKPDRSNGYQRQESFDIEKFISDHGIKVAKRSSFKGGQRLVLEECPFDPNHKAPDSAIFVTADGAIGFKCYHNSCSHYTWRDVRLKYDPGAYERRDVEEFRQRSAYYGRVTPPAPVIMEEDEKKGKKWKPLSSVEYVDPSKLVSIPTGILELDRKIMGLTLGDVTVFSGLSGSGKTTLLDLLILNAVQRGYKCAAFSGELQDFRFQAWIDQMAAGKAFVKQKPGFDGIYYAPKHICDKINAWLDGKFWIYNNDYGSHWTQLFSDIEECVRDNGVQLVLIDNLMMLQLDSYQGEKNEKQTQFITSIKDFAKRAGIHVVVVCHPRKEQSFQLLRKESIAGTADLTNMADNVIISHRVGRDFERRARDFFGEEKVAQLSQYDSIIEVVKNRALGVVDHLVGLYYERETRRLKNDPAEHIVYGWQEEPVQTSFDDLPMEKGSTLEDIPDEAWYNKDRGRDFDNEQF